MEAQFPVATGPCLLRYANFLAGTVHLPRTSVKRALWRRQKC